MTIWDDPVLVSADWYLGAWARWMREDGPEVARMLGYRFKSGPFSTGGLSTGETWDHMCEAEDLRDIQIVDRIVSLDMKPIHYAVICNAYLASVWRYRGDPVVILEEAMRAFWEAAQRAGLR